MARLLNIFLKKLRIIGPTSIVILAIGLSISIVYAASYSGYFTAYAMGNQYGGAGVEIRQGHFANHYYNWCPNDPAAWWLWGTRIVASSSIAQHNQSGGTVYYRTFYLYDVGDPTCSMGNYWADIYFGRWRRNSDTCNCPGVTSPGYCYIGSANSCTDAINYGVHWSTYTGP